ncbi:hypothetical protein NEMBOFW57_006359 [Staphylotrichum longicolle]|uniref:ABC transporter domain-containing protein n=1 Tax=Staphylotrichum longicolle TaxID=669026 RepID=A0AAD4I170_9PEZI|nr:hypothetical protein NEMBOFW57_006359 [Staphylotrichum longicolle]
MSWSPKDTADGQTVFDASASDTDVEVTRGFADVDRNKDQGFQKRLTLTFKDVTVNVTAPGEALGETLWSRINPSQLRSVFNKEKAPKGLLVLGRPGAGCTSLLRVLSNQRESFDEVEGEVRFGSMDHKEARRYRQQITFNTEDDIHFPTLTVNQTLKFALRNKVPREREQHPEEKHEYVNTQHGILDSSGPMQFWDQPTRGLDSKTALSFAELLRTEADQNGRTIVATMYQAGNGIYKQFDKVLVLADGCVIYYGPANTAQRYFESLGFVCPKGANIADFLTSVTVATERVIAPGFEQTVPNTPQEFESAYMRSSVCRHMRETECPTESLAAEVDGLKAAVQREKKERRLNGKRSVYTVGLRDQIINCTIRQFQIIMSDRLSLAVKVFSATVQALVCGSLFYNLPTTSESIFLRPGVLFFPILYFLMEAMSETTASFRGRPILARQKRFGFYTPTAYCIANALADIPVVLVQVTIFSIILYFMAALQMDAGKFFTFWIIVNANNLVFLQLFRMVGALCGHFGTASQLTGLLSTVFFVYGGYLIPFQSMHPWFRWIFYLNPGAYAFESLMANEFTGLDLDCVAPQYVPYGPQYESSTLVRHHGCTVLGSDSLTGRIDGHAYISEQYSYATGHIWRGFGVLIGFWVAFIAVTALAFELRTGDGGSSVLLYRRSLRNKKASQDIESTRGGKVARKRKTTLLDVLAQRKDFGEIRGSILIDGKPQGVSFQRMTGYCEQMDVHEGTSTVKEALVFSALLRQPRSVSEAEKLAYVEHIIDLLELRDICDALIGVPGAGLSIEQRKRVTLGVELVAKPTLLFLDEPTSGLDGQSAYNIVRFLRRLVDAGDDSAKVLNYFARYGAPCPDDINPADHIVEVIQGNGELKIDWVDVWNKSPERQQQLEKLLTLTKQGAASNDQNEDGAEFASPKWFQFKMVLYRLMIQLWRSPDYVWNKINLHIFAALFSGFTFWKIGDGSFDLQLRVFAVFNFIFVAPGCINQMQPFFLHNRDLFETREKKVSAAEAGKHTRGKEQTADPTCLIQQSKTYHWMAFIGAQIVSEIPYLIICATLYFCCWYFTAGFPVDAKISGHIYLQMIFYEFLYTSMGQAIAAYAPNEYFAAISNPLLIGCGLISFCGVVVPYTAMQPFWKYWLYYLDPFHYLVGGLLGTVVWDVQVKCKPEEFTSFDPPMGQTCGQYMADFLGSNAGYIENGNATTACQYCPYETGADYAKMFNLNEKYYAWRDTGITALFCVSSYALVILMMKLRSKKTKSARSD